MQLIITLIDFYPLIWGVKQGMFSNEIIFFTEHNYNFKYVSSEKVLTSTYAIAIFNISVFTSTSIISLPYVFNF